MRTIDSPALAAPLGHYSHVVVHRGLAHISGQLPLDAAGNLVGTQFGAQVHQVLDNLDHCLQTAGTTRDRLVSVTVYTTDLNLWALFDQQFAKWLGNHRPARAVITVAALHDGSNLEVQAVAALPDDQEETP